MVQKTEEKKEKTWNKEEPHRSRWGAVDIFSSGVPKSQWAEDLLYTQKIMIAHLSPRKRTRKGNALLEFLNDTISKALKYLTTIYTYYKCKKKNQPKQ